MTSKTNDGIIRNAPAKTTPDPGPVVLPSIFDHAPAKRTFFDHLLGSNSENGKWELVSWTTIKARLKAYFDTVYVSFVGVATSAEVNTGTDNEKFISPSAIGGSIYRRVYIQDTEPTSPKEGDLWIKTI